MSTLDPDGPSSDSDGRSPPDLEIPLADALAADGARNVIFELPPELAEVEVLLASFQVSSIAADRERLMFALGREVAKRATACRDAADRSSRPCHSEIKPSGVILKTRVWQAAAAVLALLSCGLMAVLMLRPERIVVAKPAGVPHEVAKPRESNINAHDELVSIDHESERPSGRGSLYFAQRQIAVMQSVEANLSRSPLPQRTETAADPQPVPPTAGELRKSWPEVNDNARSISGPKWLQWLNPEAWL